MKKQPIKANREAFCVPARRSAVLSHKSMISSQAGIAFEKATNTDSVYTNTVSVYTKTVSVSRLPLTFRHLIYVQKQLFNGSFL